MSPASRAEYMRERRERNNLKQIVFTVDADKARQLDEKLAKRNEKRIDWFRRKLDEELSTE